MFPADDHNVLVLYIMPYLRVVFVLGDLNASDITMSDEDRIQLMIMVKEGKLSMHEAVEAVSIRSVSELWACW